MLYSSNPYFDLDPAITNELPSGVIGPGGSVLLDVIVLTLCSIALFGETNKGRTIHWKFVYLAAIPLVSIWLHGQSDPLQYVHSSMWISAIMACVTLAHVSRGESVSILAPIVLLALTIPLLASAAFAYGDYAQLIRYFEQNTEEVLLMNGMQIGSQAAAVFEERLRSYGPMGWFTTPNVFGGVLLSLGVIWAFVSAASGNNKKLHAFSAGFIAVLCSIAAISTLSKAVVVLVVIGTILSLTIFLTNIMKKWGGWIAFAFVLAAVYTVFLRGFFDETFMSERSLFVRSQYFVGGLEIAGKNVFLGVGPMQIQDAWLGVRTTSAAEAVISTHNIVIDWLVSFGIFAFCWIAILATVLWNAGKKMYIGDHTKKRQIFAAGLSVAAIILVVDAQIDLTMFDIGSALFAFCLLGIAGSFLNSKTATKKLYIYRPMIPAFLAGVILYFGYMPLAHDAFLQRVAATSIIAGDSTEEVAAALSNQCITRQSSLIAAKLFVSTGNLAAARLSLEKVAPNAGVWFIRLKAAATPNEAVIAAQKLVELDPNGLQSVLLLADAYWKNSETGNAFSAYERVFQLNNAYQHDPARTLSRARIMLINQRLEQLQ